MGWKAGDFVGTLAVALSLGSAGVAFGGIKIIDDGLHLVSPYLDLRVSLERPGFWRWRFTGWAKASRGRMPCALRRGTTPIARATVCATVGCGWNIVAAARRPRPRPDGNSRSATATCG